MFVFILKCVHKCWKSSLKVLNWKLIHPRELIWNLKFPLGKGNTSTNHQFSGVYVFICFSHQQASLLSMGFSGTPKDMGPPYGKLPIPLPQQSLKIWEWYGKLTIRGSHYWGSLESPLILVFFGVINESSSSELLFFVLNFFTFRTKGNEAINYIILIMIWLAPLTWTSWSWRCMYMIFPHISSLWNIIFGNCLWF